MATIYSITADGQERYDTVRQEMIAKTIKLLQRKGALTIRVIWPYAKKHQSFAAVVAH